MPPDASMPALVACLVVGLALPFVTAPVRIRLNNWHAADPDFQPLADPDLPTDATQAVAELKALGFETRGHWTAAGGSHAQGRLTLLEHPHTRDAAKVLVVDVPGRRPVTTVVFQTRFADDTEVATANNTATVGFPPLPGVTVAWLPEVRDATRLYRVHEQVRDAVGGARRRLAVGPDPVAFLRAGSDRMHAHWLATGYFYRDPAGDIYRPTWKGAALMSWRLLWPVKPLFRAARRRKTARLLGRLGVSVPLAGD